MKVLLLSTNIFPLPPAGYSGLEALVYNWAVEMHRQGAQVAVMAPKGSVFPAGIELLGTEYHEPDEASYNRYRQNILERLQNGWVVIDHTWSWYSVYLQQEADRQLPIIRFYHSDPHNLGAAPLIAKPCIVSCSEAQANVIRSRWSVAVRVIPHGIDTTFYTPAEDVKRSDRYLFLARYTAEKGFLEISYLAKKCRVPLDAYGDTEIIGDRSYMERCFGEADGRLIKVNPGISREQVVQMFRSHKALITWPNFLEIFGLTTVEAQACGCPVISKDSGAAKELIRQGKTGFVVSTLEEAEELIKNDAVKNLKTTDIVAQAQKFSIQKSAEKYLKVCQDLLEGHYW